MPLHAQVWDYMMQKIESGEWKKGGMIPKEIDLCQQLSVSRSTVRTAMSKLVREGYLNRVKGKGTFVAQPAHIEETTIFLESFAQELQTRGLTAKTELLEFREVMPDALLAERMRVPEGGSLLKITRLRYADKAFDTGPIVLTTSYFPVAYAGFIQRYNLEEVPMHRALRENGLDRKLFEKEITCKVLEDKEARLLGVPGGAMAVCITSMAWDQNQRELEYSVSNYPVGKNKFIIRIRA